ncbi:hypothetical protein [Blastococcus xanthinilyticus]|uniref:Uncharacterized protein n=1 Tax=Blastococcus xanthinilyticus TaxID=1564164 RepID=A0A5S5D012_9ACTN|nr:hypothetical protein [Blastococcus xanthinilyticus]TYP87959.1 hypothetical protein BD833_105134 [Blastococcus xanthinilyticus]
MATVELTCPTTLWDLARGEADRDAVVATMEHRLPPDGLAAPAMPRRYRLTAATLRLLDSRILRAALEILDLDVAAPVLRGLTGYQRVADAARETGPPTGSGEVTAVLLQPHPLPWTEEFEVGLHVEGHRVATFAFRLEVVVEVGETAVVVRGGAIDRVTCEAASVTASLTFVGWPEPLWAPEPRTVPMSLVVRPPLPVPVRRSGVAPAVPEPRGTADSRPASVTDDGRRLEHPGGAGDRARG